MYVIIDIETYSEVDLKTSGLFKYIEDKSFEILLISYAIDNDPVKTIDLASGEKYTTEFLDLFFDPDVIKVAHNAQFERTAFNKVGLESNIDEWLCTMGYAAYCGLPLGLDDLSKVLDLKNKKQETGTLLIKYFSVPCKGTAKNGYRTRNMPYHDEQKWLAYCTYNKQDVLAEQELLYWLLRFEFPEKEKAIYRIDQKINAKGVKIEQRLAQNAQIMYADYVQRLKQEVYEKTGISNIKSVQQLTDYISLNFGIDLPTLLADNVKGYIETYKDNKPLVFLLNARLQASKSSISKYESMLNACCADGRVKGLFQYYGAMRTGRFASRIVQLHNLKKNYISDLTEMRKCVLANDLDSITLYYDNPPDIFSQLIRTAFIPETDTFKISDLSAIEARVISWLADEEWRLDVFRTHGKIYEATASKMFKVPIESVTKTSDIRFKAKTAELALGYQGWIEALKRSLKDKNTMTDTELKDLVLLWRKANPNIVALWQDFEDCALYAVAYESTAISKKHGIEFSSNKEYLTIKLPSGRKLYYYKPAIAKGGKKEKMSVSYMGIDQDSTAKIWTRVYTYGGKLTENIVQAIARDVLAEALLVLEKEGIIPNIHVHDELVSEDADLNQLIAAMSLPIQWAPGLPVTAEGFTCEYYKKD